MRKLLIAAALAALLPATQAAPASDASIETLLKLTRAEQTNQTVLQQMRGVVKSQMDQAMQHVQVTAEAREKATAAMNKYMERTMDLMAAELAWDKMRPMTVDIYRSTFSQEEVDAMVGFYSSSAGQSVIVKLPQVMQMSMQMTQQRMGPVMQKVMQGAQQMVEELKGDKP